MDVYITVNHKLSEVDRKLLKDLFENFVQDEFSQFEANDPFIQHFIVQIDALFIPFKVIIYIQRKRIQKMMETEGCWNFTHFSTHWKY